MKTTIKLLFALLITLTTSCQSDDDGGGDPISQLPPATQTGANTAGCLVDGVPLTPKSNGGLNNVFQCFYQQVDGEFFFSISFTDEQSEFGRTCQIFTIMAQIEKNTTYELNIDDSGESTGHGGQYRLGVTEEFKFSTSESVTGELTITKLDFQNNIVSGTFFFDAISITGDSVSITEGRFDAQFIQ